MIASRPAVVYQATNIITGDFYVGVTAVGIDRRREFMSATDAAKYYGIQESGVAQAIGRNGRIYGLKFEYVEAA